MAAIDFPNSPVVNDLFTVGNRTWKYTGYSWDTVETVAATGPTGPANTLTIGTVTSTGPTFSPAVTISGTAPSQTLSFVLQQGPTGPTGPTSLPTQTGNTGKYLQTDGTTATWQSVVALPTQTGNTGKYLTTDGTTASWSTVNALPTQTSNAGYFLTTNATTASWTNTITANAAATVALIVKGTTSQSAYLQSWQNTGGTVVGSMDVSGNFIAAGDITTNSDLRLKTNIKIIDNALYRVTKLEGITYNLKSDLNGKDHTGLIAQDVEDVIPEAVIEDEDGIKSVAYGNLVGLLVEAIKEQQLQINELKERLDGI